MVARLPAQGNHRFEVRRPAYSDDKRFAHFMLAFLHGQGRSWRVNVSQRCEERKLGRWMDVLR